MMNARSVILMAWGEDKASIVAKTVEGKVSDAVPSSYLQNHPNAKVVIDLSAAYDLTRISHPWLVTSCEWDNKLILPCDRLVVSVDGQTDLEIDKQGL